LINSAVHPAHIYQKNSCTFAEPTAALQTKTKAPIPEFSNNLTIIHLIAYYTQVHIQANQESMHATTKQLNK
jgi:hypothetical protein